jgi:WD40 repeat protein
MCGVRAFIRLIVLIGLVAAALGAMMWTRRAPDAAREPPRLTYIATAQQQGVVGYRDPVGAISLDGRTLAFAEGRRLYEQPLGGGVSTPLAIAEGQIRHLVPDGLGAWIFEDTAAAARWWLASSRMPMRRYFGDRAEIEGTAAGDRAPTRRRVNDLRQLAASADGRWLAAIANGPAGNELWRIAVDGWRAEIVRIPDRVAWPAWTPTGEIACTVLKNGEWQLAIPCGQPPLTFTANREVFGPLAFSPQASEAFFASPNASGFVELWAVNRTTRAPRRLAGLDRDTYAPSTTSDGIVLFKTQTYRTAVAELDLASGTFQQLSTLQAETPSYHPDGRRLGVTYGTWRRLIDDAKYPDIAQEVGVIAAMPVDRPSDAPLDVIANSDSEDQSMAWSPNGRWIAFHSHREQSDDIWLRPADKSALDRRVSFLGRGAEVGWPRWSPDGRWLLYDGASPKDGRSVLFVLGVNQETGEVTAQAREVEMPGFAGELTHAEWLPDNATLIAIGKDAPGRHLIVTAPAAGGAPRVVHRFATEHDFPGLAVSPDGRDVAFVAPAPDGFYQIFRMPIAGGTPAQVTLDRSHKTQPAWSPDGRRIAYTVWSYIAQFWSLRP